MDTLNHTFENSYDMLADTENALEVASGRSGCYPNPCSNVTGLNNDTVQCIEMSDLAGFQCEDCPAGFLGDGQVCTAEAAAVGAAAQAVPAPAPDTSAANSKQCASIAG
eukprot:COSAG06_NODE_16239_length_1011_cov_2.018640_1_plen_108_part_01